MAAPTATRLAVRYRLIDTDSTNPLLSDSTTLDNAIAAAVAKYGQDRPRIVVADVTGNGTPFYVLVGSGAVLSAWADQSSVIEQIEYPAAAVGADRPNTSKRIRGVLPVTLEQAELIALATGHELVLVPIEPRLARRRLLAATGR